MQQANAYPPESSLHHESSTSIERTDLPKPWAPFRLRQDIEYAETVVQGLMRRRVVDKQLNGMHSNWMVGGSNITSRSNDDLQVSLAAAREYTQRFEWGHVEVDYKGNMVPFDFPYRDPITWMRSLLQDETLSESIMWHSVRKTYHENGNEIRIIDEPNTADGWWDIDDELPEPDPHPHCFVPFHVWLDKGMVTKRVKKHPIVLRAAFLPWKIRNGSGNGGGVLLGFMPEIPDPDDPDDRNTQESDEFASFKRSVYQAVLGYIFHALLLLSCLGEAIKCGDTEIRVAHPGIFIVSLDAEEAANFECVKHARANHPCPNCLVGKCNLHKLNSSFEVRTIQAMRAVLRRVELASTKGEAERLLQEYGLHDTKHFMWEYRFTDPYLAYMYDLLHSDDLGKWGKHLWPKLLQILKEVKHGKSRLEKNMQRFPRWPKSKHFNKVSETEFADGQAFFDILKNSVVVHCIRAYQRLRIMAGMHVMTDVLPRSGVPPHDGPSPTSSLHPTRMERLQRFIREYGKQCDKLGDQYDKNFNFLKQHATVHLPSSIRYGGTTINSTTRIGEGFQQEIAQAYRLTNCRDTEKQIARHDETGEALAQIRMAVDEYDQKLQEESEDDSDWETEDEEDEDVESTVNREEDAALAREGGTLDHWALRSPFRAWTNSRFLEDELKATSLVKDFHAKLWSFLQRAVHGVNALDARLSIKIRSCRALYLRYQSEEDWSEAVDILRCSPKQAHSVPKPSRTVHA
ncbi:uncharacterized protein STEHIDRAFT_116235 [Stereum hirsutum FP-91666 SS1]|uniref:Uncharacterized protein n=1 Tax=Stereum hirsutum (strain FP-91666) TaxID=721885 RepID=R7RXX3_STEHR|nr:uncharacterized protein STEHIDRAFT_116235 [Stereum hirsutum FP-91666 SS1]EIM79745.1 hypothetical protein STEHIDRAFT_116235 [Stereum hirsutum FP-91666 SS1]